MKVKDKANAFVNLLATKLKKERATKKSVEVSFTSAIETLPPGKLKNCLQDKLPEYLIQLQGSLSYAEKTKDKQKKVHSVDDRGTAAFPYNLYGKKKYTIDVDEINSRTPEEQSQLYSALIGQTYPKTGHNEQIQCSLQAGGEEQHMFPWLHSLKAVCGAVCCQTPADSQSLQQLLSSFLSDLTTSAAKCIKKNRLKRLEYLRTQTLNILMFCHLQRQRLAVPYNKPSYEDQVAAILSIYVDMLMVLTRGSKEVKKERKHIAVVLLHFLQHSLHHTLDVIIQVSDLTAEDSSLVVPVSRHLLSSLQIEGPHQFTKMVAMARKLKEHLPQEDIEELLRLTEAIPAPVDYLSWLEAQDAGLLEEMPVTSHFYGVHVTRFLIQEADGEFIQQLLDLLTVTVETEETIMEVTGNTKSAVQDPTSSTPVPPAGQEPNQPFFLDKTADSQVPSGGEEPAQLFFVDKSADPKTKEVTSTQEGGTVDKETQAPSEEIVVGDTPEDSDIEIVGELEADMVSEDDVESEDEDLDVAEVEDSDIEFIESSHTTSHADPSTSADQKSTRGQKEGNITQKRPQSCSSETVSVKMSREAEITNRIHSPKLGTEDRKAALSAKSMSEDSTAGRLEGSETGPHGRKPRHISQTEAESVIELTESALNETTGHKKKPVKSPKGVSQVIGVKRTSTETQMEADADFCGDKLPLAGPGLRRSRRLSEMSNTLESSDITKDQNSTSQGAQSAAKSLDLKDGGDEGNGARLESDIGDTKPTRQSRRLSAQLGRLQASKDGVNGSSPRQTRRRSASFTEIKTTQKILPVTSPRFRTVSESQKGISKESESVYDFQSDSDTGLPSISASRTTALKAIPEGTTDAGTCRYPLRDKEKPGVDFMGISDTESETYIGSRQPQDIDALEKMVFGSKFKAAKTYSRRSMTSWSAQDGTPVGGRKDKRRARSFGMMTLETTGADRTAGQSGRPGEETVLDTPTRNKDLDLEAAPSRKKARTVNVQESSEHDQRGSDGIQKKPTTTSRTPNKPTRRYSLRTPKR